MQFLKTTQASELYNPTGAHRDTKKSERLNYDLNI